MKKIIKKTKTNHASWTDYEPFKHKEGKVELKILEFLYEEI